MLGGHVLALEVIAGQNLIVPSNRTPAGHYVLVSTSYGQWNTAIKPAMADCGVSWNEILTICGSPLMFPMWLMPIFSSSSKEVRLEIRASFECGQMLGRGELVGTVETTLDQLLAHDGQSVSLPAVDNQHVSLKLKARRKKIPHQDADGIMQHKIALDTDAARDAYTLFWRSNLREHFHSAIEGFQAVLDQCPHDHAHRAAALSNLAHAILCGFAKSIDNDIDRAIHLFRSALTLRPRGHVDHPLSILDLCHALCKRHSYQKDHTDLREAADLYRSVLPLCIEGSHLHRVVFGTNGIPYVIEQCNALPSDPSDESISLRRIVLELCPPRHPRRAHSLDKLAGDLYARFERDGNKDHFYEAIYLSREALAVCRADEDQLSALPGILSDTLGHRFNHHGDPSDLYERIALDTHLEAVDLRSSASSRRGITAPEQGQQPSPPPPPRPLRPQASTSKTRPLERNVVIFGDSGSGKSSVINAIAQTQLAKTSSSATGCTFAYERHRVEISGQTFVLFDTAGLNEGTAGTVPAAKAEENLKSLLQELMSPKSDGIGLLVYCVRSTRARRALIRNYNIFYSAICRKKVPIVVVVTGLENELDMESWWDANGKEFKSRGMHFEDHACVTTLRKHSGISDVFTRRIDESSEALRNLLVNNCSDWVVDDGWFKQSFTAVRNLISDSGNSERSLPSTLIICDPSRSEDVEIAHCIRGTLRPYFVRIGGDTYQVHRVPAPDSSSLNADKRPEGDLLIYYARADELSAARQKFYSFCTAYRGNVVPVVVVVKGLDDRQAANQWVEKHITYDGAGRLFSTFAPAEELGDDSLKQQAEQELQDLIRQASLIRSERKVRGKPKRLARRNRF
ncbi:uncharacterized protein EDB93DRAFT_140810 [Suillus bovinus]|uniref:uncharacterized protein n=1 Tax=Suillus bovinus TaxID=48563 RepID=UPI001B886D41|nr:uncharacterized protein EDB93DRAFT_140810 [Suillus bovinus]KAG2129172.1 hypothetical protein EDB93DRAFT_140810 [Suillus bovinus]